MKIFQTIFLFIGMAAFISSCEKDVIDTPSSVVKLVNKADSVYAGERATFDFSGSAADNITIYTGDPGHVYENYPVSKGAAVTAPFSKFYYTYPQGGDFTVTIISENAGSTGKTKVVVSTFLVSVRDARNPLISKFLIKKGEASYTGVIDNAASTINFNLTSVTSVGKWLPVITKSADSLKITFGDALQKFNATDSVDFSNPVKFKISTNASTGWPAKSKEYTVTVNVPVPAKRVILNEGK